MDQSGRDTVTWILGTLMTLVVLGGFVTRFILLPWLSDHLLGPIRDTHRQVSENGHHNRLPTIPDRLDDLSAKVDEAQEAHTVQARDLAALTRVLDEHLRWADRWVDVVDRELELLKGQPRNRENGERNG